MAHVFVKKGENVWKWAHVVGICDADPSQLVAFRGHVFVIPRVSFAAFYYLNIIR